MENKITESRLQSECFTHHWNTYPQERGQLFMVYNNPKNAAHGSILKAMGMLPGVSDLIYLTSDGRLTFAECKLPGCNQSVSQRLFEQRVKSLGHTYGIFTDLKSFLQLIGK